MPVKRTVPTVGITDPNFRYRHSTDTDIAKTFARVKREQKKADLQAQAGQQALDLAPGVLVLRSGGGRSGQ